MAIMSLLIVLPGKAGDNIPPSFDPPGGLVVDSVPLFIVLGFDDNYYVDGMEWTLEMLDGKKNPEGTNNPATFDNLPICASFYYISGALEGDDGTLLNTWLTAVEKGYEVANHTVTHETGISTSLAEWRSEIDVCRATLSKMLEIPGTDIVGFRTPYLAFNEATFTAVAEENMLYECTMTQMQDYNKNMFVWPYTLDEGFADKVIEGWVGKCKIPGLWEIPVYTMGADATMWPPITGFDSSILTQSNGNLFETMMKNALAYRIEEGGNRVPLTIGLHSDTYSEENPSGSIYDPALTLPERRQALENFVIHALKNPIVRFVSAKQLIDWMRNPIPLGREPVTSIIHENVASSKASLEIGMLKANTLQLSVPEAGAYNVRIYIVSGRTITYSQKMKCIRGSNIIRFNSVKLANGAYIVTVTGADLQKSAIVIKQ